MLLLVGRLRFPRKQSADERLYLPAFYFLASGMCWELMSQYGNFQDSIRVEYDDVSDSIILTQMAILNDPVNFSD